MNLLCFHQWVSKPVIYQHLHVNGLKLFTLVKEHVCKWMIPTIWKRPETPSLIHSAAAAEITEQNKWMILQMRAVQRQVTATTSQQYWQGKRRRTAEHTPCWSRRDRTKWKAEQIKESSHTRKYKMCAHTGHVTFVPLTFASGDNEPACLFSTSLVRYSFFSLPNKDSSDHGGVQMRKGWVEKKNQWFHTGGR